MNREAKNAVITLSNLNNTKAEIFWQTINCQKIAEHYREDLSKQGTKGQFHDLLFAEYRTYHQVDHEKFIAYEETLKEKFGPDKPSDE